MLELIKAFPGSAASVKAPWKSTNPRGDPYEPVSVTSRLRATLPVQIEDVEPLAPPSRALPPPDFTSIFREKVIPVLVSSDGVLVFVPLAGPTKMGDVPSPR